VSAAH